jgi:glycosyltransferase involved in cell wall biosynthesis
MKVLLVGAGYFPNLTAGEKNFFYRLVPLLQGRSEVSVFSLNDLPDEVLWQDTGDVPVPVYCARRPFHRNYDRFFFVANGYTAYHHRHRPPQEIFERFVSFVAHARRLRQILADRHIELVHFMDNFGLAMPLLRVIAPGVKVTFAAANYHLRGSRGMYDAYLRLSLGWLHAAGVYSQAYVDRLRAIGVRIPLELIHWGVPIPENPITLEGRDARRAALGVGRGQTLVLWSGFLQQIGEADFLRTIDVARQVVARIPNVSFLFTFKPESYREAYAREMTDRISVVTRVPDFTAVLEAADLFLSPIGAVDSTVSPPLTWLEAMARGTPVVTTDIGGVREAIEHAKTGYIATSYETLADGLIEAVRDPGRAAVAAAARKVARRRFSLDAAAHRHIAFWQGVLRP